MTSKIKSETISIFIPLRKGSKRILKKNSKPFTMDGQSLFQYKINQVLKILDKVDELVISTDDQEIINQIPNSLKENNKFKLVERLEELCGDKTKVKDLIKHAEAVTTGDIIFWIHVTSPFVDELDFLKAIKKFKEIIKKGEGDSLMSVNSIQQFIWDDKSCDVINNNNQKNRWPNTQDLKPYYEINHAFYMNYRNSYLRDEDRIGKNPGLYICDGIKKIDIDLAEDFEIAQYLIELHKKKNV